MSAADLGARVREAHGDYWQLQGRMRDPQGAVAELRDLRCMHSGLPHPWWSGAYVAGPDPDLAGAHDFYARRDAQLAVRVAPEHGWARGRLAVHKRLMGREPGPPPPFEPIDGLELRRATIADAETVLAIDANAFDADPMIERHWTVPHLRFAPASVVLALLGGTPAGTAYAIRSDDRAGPAVSIAGVAVLPEARRRGIAAAMTAWLLRGEPALAHLSPDTDAAARIYARLGFAELPGLDVYVSV